MTHFWSGGTRCWAWIRLGPVFDTQYQFLGFEFQDLSPLANGRELYVSIVRQGLVGTEFENAWNEMTRYRGIWAFKCIYNKNSPSLLYVTSIVTLELLISL